MDDLVSSRPMSDLEHKVAEAWETEWDRWITRDAGFLGFGHQVCRFDDSGLAGSFAQTFDHYPTADAALQGMEYRREKACARAVIAAVSADRNP